MFASTLVTLFAASLAAAVPMRHAIAPRAIEARTYAQDAEILEPYHQYNTRYIALSCQTKHGKPFFDTCCHPLLKSQKLSERPSECTPTVTASTSAAAVDATQIPPPGAVDDGDDGDYEDCDDDDDEYTSIVSVAKPTASSAKPTSVAQTTAKGAAATTTVKATSVAETTVKATSAVESTVEASSAAETTTHVKPTTTHVKPSTTSTKAAATTPASGGSANLGGFATYFMQGGNAGACGKVHSDSDLIVAIDEHRYGSSSKASDLCGKQVKITNTKNGKSVVATVADDCPSCVNSNSIDLSEGTFKSIATLDEGMVPISWVFV